jgi:hypothetical protein
MLAYEPKHDSVSSGIEETKILETLNDPSGPHLVRNPQTSVSSGVEETKTLETLHDSSGLHPVWKPQNFRELRSRRNPNPRDFT